MLEWRGPDESGVLRAWDNFALYVISLDEFARYRVGYFPSPGPECSWSESHGTIEEAKTSAEACVRHVLGTSKSPAGRTDR